MNLPCHENIQVSNLTHLHFVINVKFEKKSINLCIIYFFPCFFLKKHPSFLFKKKFLFLQKSSVRGSSPPRQKSSSRGSSPARQKKIDELWESSEKPRKNVRRNSSGASDHREESKTSQSIKGMTASSCNIFFAFMDYISCYVKSLLVLKFNCMSYV